MIGGTFLFELRNKWKGLTIFLVIALVVVGGMVQLFPVVVDAMEEDVEELEGEERVRVETEEGNVTIDWDPVENATHYRILEDTGSHMATSQVLEKNVEDNEIKLFYDTEEERYFAIIAVFKDDEKEVFVGMGSTVERKSPVEELMEAPYFRAFTAGRQDVDFRYIEGFLSVELYSWWFLLVGLYLAYISVNGVTDDYEERRLDILFSNPISRRRFLVEKFLVLTFYAFVLLSVSSIVLIGSLHSVGELQNFGVWTAFASVLASWPLFLVVIAFSMLFAVKFKRSRTAVGLSLMIALIMYAFHIAGNMVDALEWVKNFTILTYWDYNSVLLDGVFKTGHFAGLFLLGALIFVAAILIFEKEDILA